MLSIFANNLRKIFAYSNIKIQTDKLKRVTKLTLTRKDKRNPLSFQTLQEIESALKEIQKNSLTDRINMLILRGEGSVFSAGHDLIQLMNTKNPEKIFNQCTKTMLCLKNLGLITLCAVDNAVTAAGLQLALTCDLIIASQSATFGIPGMKRGLFPSTPHVQLQRSLKSPCLAREISLIGEMLTAQQAYKIGIVNKLVPTRAHLQKQIENYIQKAQSLSSEVIALGKKTLNSQIQTGSLEQAYAIATKGMAQNLLEKDDCKQGLSAFVEKRLPNFQK